MENYNFSGLLSETDSHDKIIEFAQKFGIIPRSAICDSCGKVLTKCFTDRDYTFFRCSCSSRRKISVTHDTILKNSKITIRTFLIIVYGFVEQWKYRQVRKECDRSVPLGSGPAVSDATIAKYFKFFRDLVLAEVIDDDAKMDTKIGGEGRIVEIDESCFGKRKYNLGSALGRHQLWILGGVDRTSGECFLEICPDNVRDMKTLNRLILKRVKPNTTIFTDGWAGYFGLEKLGVGYSWDSVNHSKNYVKPGSGGVVHTNSIEGRWRCVKRQLPSSGRYRLESHLPMYIWRKRVQRHYGQDAHFSRLLDIIGRRQHLIARSLDKSADPVGPRLGDLDTGPLSCLRSLREDQVTADGCSGADDGVSGPEPGPASSGYQAAMDTEECVVDLLPAASCTDSDKPYCFYCGKSFKNLQSLNIHSRTCSEAD